MRLCRCIATLRQVTSSTRTGKTLEKLAHVTVQLLRLSLRCLCYAGDIVSFAPTSHNPSFAVCVVRDVQYPNDVVLHRPGRLGNYVADIPV